MRGTLLLHNWSSPFKTLFLFIISYKEVKQNVSSALWRLNRGENNGKAAYGIAKRWPRPLNRGLTPHSFLLLLWNFSSTFVGMLEVKIKFR